MDKEKSRMGMIFGLISVLLMVLASARAAHHDKIALSPKVYEVVKFINDSYIITCSPRIDIKVKWLNPKGATVNERKGRIHVEYIGGGLALVFEQIVLADKGEWSCAWVDGKDTKSTFQLTIKQDLMFVDTPPVQVAQENKGAIIRCKAVGDPVPKISWSFNGSPIHMANPRYGVSERGLSIKNVSLNDGGEYTCKGYQISPTLVNSKEQIIRLNIQHKPMLRTTHSGLDSVFGYQNGSVNLTCEAVAEPAANFTWYRNGKKLLPTQYPIHPDLHSSTLEVFIVNSSYFGSYKCKVANMLGGVEQLITLKEGVKPIPPTRFEVLDVSTDMVIVDLGFNGSQKLTEMDVIGFRFQFITLSDFTNRNQSWLGASQMDFVYENETIPYSIFNMSADTTYLLRVATRNIAGLSDFSEPKTIQTLVDNDLFTNHAASTKLGTLVDHWFTIAKQLMIATLFICVTLL